MAEDEHRHGEDYWHTHDGGDSPHVHTDIEETVSDPPEGPTGDVTPDIVETHIDNDGETTAEVAEAALDAITEMHRQEEETERTEAIAEALTDVAEASADAIAGTTQADELATTEVAHEPIVDESVDEPTTEDGEPIETVEPPNNDSGIPATSSERAAARAYSRGYRFGPKRR